MGGRVGSFLSSIDPTTSDGLMNISTGGLYGVGQAASEGLADVDDYIRNEEGMQAAEDAARDAAAIQQQVVDLQREQIDFFRPFQQSYLESSDQLRDELLRFLDPQAQAQVAQDAITGDYGQAVLGSAADQLVSQGTALGNRLSSGIQRDLLSQQGNLSQQIGQQAIDRRQAQLLNNLSGFQAGAAGTSGPIQQAVSGVSQGLTNIGSIGTQQAALEAQNSGFNPYLNIIGATAPIIGAVV